MARVTYPLQQPDSTMDGASLDTFLTDMQTETASLDSANFRDRGLDHRAVADNVVADLMNFNGAGGPIEHVTRTVQTMSAGTYIALDPGTLFVTPDLTIDTSDLIELEASIYVSTMRTGSVRTGLQKGDELRVRLEYSTNSGSTWSELAGSERRMGNTAATAPNQYGNSEPMGVHGSVAPFAVYEGSTGSPVMFRVAVRCQNSNDVYFEDSQFSGVLLRRI